MPARLLRLAIVFASVVGLSPLAAAPARPPAYVAMGSSFAAGPGLPGGDPASGRCQRSAGNYAHRLAHIRTLALSDVSCSGATTRNVLHAWGDLPAQIDAVTTGTKLVTVTIGGNDVGLIGGLIKASCRRAAPVNPLLCSSVLSPPRGSDRHSSLLAEPTEEGWRELTDSLVEIADRVGRRAPDATLAFVTYPSVMPPTDLCAATPLDADAAAEARRSEARLAAVTRAAARKAGALLVDVAALSRGHDACSPVPWVSGFQPPAQGVAFVPYHPTVAGMAAAAAALDRALPPLTRP